MYYSTDEVCLLVCDTCGTYSCINLPAYLPITSHHLLTFQLCTDAMRSGQTKAWDTCLCLFLDFVVLKSLFFPHLSES